MPGLNGYEVCENLKQQSDTQHIPVIFLSGCDSLDERLKGYNAGADDYLVKPYDTEILIAKVKKLQHAFKEREMLSGEIDMARKTAMEAMASTSEMGLGIRFVERSHHVTNFDALAVQFFKVTMQLGLDCCLRIEGDAGFLYYNDHGEIKPLEKQLLDMLALQERFHDFGSRTQINYPRISLLIKNMPTDSPEHYGRLKDMLPFMLEVSNARIKNIVTDHALTKQSEKLSSSIDTVKDTLINLTASLHKNQDDVTNVMSSMLKDLDSEIPRMGLEDDQEKYLIKRIDGAVEESKTIMKKGSNLKESFGNVIRLLEHLVESQKHIIAESHDSHAEEETGGEHIADDDIELF
jgi:CheY-like chemotaxis protein